MNHRRRMRERSSASSAASVELTIHELIVEGVDVSQRFQLADAVRSELTRRIQEEGVWPGMWESGTLDTIDGGDISIQPGDRGGPVGSRIAQAVYGGLSSAGTFRQDRNSGLKSHDPADGLNQL